MELTSSSTGDIQIARLSGRFDAHEVAQVRAWFDGLTSARIVVDLAGVQFLDSSALSVLVQQMKRVRERGGDLVLCGLTQPVRIIFELTRLDRAIKIAGDEIQAVTLISAM